MQDILMASSVIFGIFCLIGLMGAIRENFCLIFTFAVFMTIITFLISIKSIKLNEVSVYPIIYLCVTLLAHSFAWLLIKDQILRKTHSFNKTDTENQIDVALNDFNASQQIFVISSDSDQFLPTRPPPYEEVYLPKI